MARSTFSRSAPTVRLAAAARRAMSATGKTDERGFTLIEMLVVLAILGLVAAIGYPAVDRALAGRHFAQAVASVEGQLHAARASAIATSRPYAFKPQDDVADEV